MSSISCSVRTSGGLCQQKLIIMRESCWSLMCCHNVRKSGLDEIVPSKCCAHISGEVGVWYCPLKVTRRQHSRARSPREFDALRFPVSAIEFPVLPKKFPVSTSREIHAESAELGRFTRV